MPDPVERQALPDLSECDPCDGCDGMCGDVCPVFEARRLTTERERPVGMVSALALEAAHREGSRARGEAYDLSQANQALEAESDRLRAENEALQENLARMQEAGDRLTAENARLIVENSRLAALAGDRDDYLHEIGEVIKRYEDLVYSAPASDEEKAT